ncbi:MAG: hypothetical protein LUC41_08785 [Clostridiales bacterium]|nr:hypothetical protein [Clostridiales bacterium]
MSSIVKCRDNRTGVVYVYESESYWDKEKKQPRARRKIIGKIDPDTGEIVPTAGRGRKKKDPETSSGSASEAEQRIAALEKTNDELNELLRQRDLKIELQAQEIEKMHSVVQDIVKMAKSAL